MFSVLPMPSRPSVKMPDYSRQREIIRRLTDTLYDFLTVDLDEDEREAREQIEAQSVTSGPGPSLDKIVHFQEEIEKVRDQLEQNREKVEMAIRGVPEGMENMFRVQLESLLVSPLEAQIKGMESYLSQMQAELEKGTAV